MNVRGLAVESRRFRVSGRRNNAGRPSFQDTRDGLMERIRLEACVVPATGRTQAGNEQVEYEESGKDGRRG